jgi:prepilin-type processing-associated H-X9-DG protein
VCSYMPDSAVMQDNSWFLPDAITHIKWANIKFKSRQLVLGETWLGTTPYLEMINSQEPNSNIWWGEARLQGVSIGSGGCILPWHGNGRTSNLLMADWHVEVNVDGNTGARYGYQGPTK